MTRKILVALSALVLAVAGLLLVAPTASATQWCNVNNGNFHAYNNEGGTQQIGYDCETTFPHGDTNWGDTLGQFRSTDNNSLESFRFYGTPNATFCLYLYTFVSYGDEWTSYRVHNGYGGSLVVLPSDWDDVVTSHQVKKVQFSAPCDNP